MDSLPETFEKYSRPLLANHPEIAVRWESHNKDGRRLTIAKQGDSGFDVVVEAETYGLYPFAGDWHGPAWEMVSKDETRQSLCTEFMGFVRSLLCADSSLEVLYAGSKPYKWILTYPTEQEKESLTTGLLFFNVFARKSRCVFQNHHLPPRVGDIGF